jgi:hypothetical protein
VIGDILHYSLHFLAPGLIAWVFFRDRWKQVWLILLATMLVDLDHLLATPIFDPDRCSIGFHPLHTLPAMVVYAGMLVFPKTRIVGIGLLFHMLTDWIDCLGM